MTAPNDPPAPAQQPDSPVPPADSRSRIIRRAPTGPLPVIPETGTTQIPRQAPPYPGAGPLGGRPPRLGGVGFGEPNDRSTVAACVVTIISGWATSVVATDLVAGWWHTDRLFCIAVAFLALVFATATISGVILLMRRRPLGRYLVAAGAVVALLTYGGVFIAGARVAWIVHTLPLLPIASLVLAMLPSTKRWLED